MAQEEVGMNSPFFTFIALYSICYTNKTTHINADFQRIIVSCKVCKTVKCTQLLQVGFYLIHNNRRICDACVEAALRW